MKRKAVVMAFALCAFVAGARAQGVVTPPVTSFKPDTSMPSVNVPEFVITGKAQIELPKADKPTVEIDSSYFQNKQLPGVEVHVPLDRAISRQNLGTTRQSPDLFARVSLGHYYTTSYLLSGSGAAGGFGINGSLSGNYTSGFIPNTMRRDFSLQAGLSKDIDSQELVKSSNSMNFGYRRSSYSLYGSPQPTLRRSAQDIVFGVNSDMYLGELPLAFALNFDRFSLDDIWHNAEFTLNLQGSTQVQLASGWFGFNGAFLFGTHTLSGSTTPPVLPPAPAVNLNRSIYDLRLQGSYGNELLLGDFTYSVGAAYYQYRDDSSSTVAKLYPDLRMNYRINHVVSIFASFNGAVRQANLAGFVSTDEYVDGSLALKNTLKNIDFTVGGRLGILDNLVFIPQVQVLSARYYPIFVSDPENVSRLMYAGKASVTSVSLTFRYLLSDFSSDLTLRYQKGEADSLSSIPNLPDFDANLGLTYRISPQFTAGVQFLFLSSRYADLALASRLDPAGLLNFRLSYDFKVSNLPLQIFAGGNNVLNEKYFIWQGYQEFPVTLYVGLSSRIL